VVDVLEQRYAEFDGLNLTFETREGILKHCSPQNAHQLGEVGERFLGNGQPSLEAQVANLADEIAYNNHDVDDGLRSGIITLEQLSQVAIFARHLDEVKSRYPELGSRRLVHETVRRMINSLVLDLSGQSAENIAAASPSSIGVVRALPPLIGFSATMQQEQQQLKQFLRANLYRHYLVNRMSSKAQRIIRELFAAFMQDPGLLPEDFQQRTVSDRARTVADYIAGMTDRYAIREYRRLFTVEEE